MSIATLIITDSAKSGVPLDFIRPAASDFAPTLSTLYINNPNINKSNQSHVFTTASAVTNTTNNNNNNKTTAAARGGSFTVSNVRSMTPGSRVGSASSPTKISGPPSPSRSRPASAAVALAGASDDTILVEEAPAIYFESPFQFGDSYDSNEENHDQPHAHTHNNDHDQDQGGSGKARRHRPDFIDDALMIELNDAAQHYGTTLDRTRNNDCPEYDTSIKEACYRYFYVLQRGLHLIEDCATDLDCMEDIELSVAETMAEALYNIFLCHFLTGSKYIGDANGRSVAHFTEAAAVIDYLMASDLASNTEKLEFSEDNLRTMSSISMATAHEVSLQYYYCDTFHQVETNAALAHKASYYYTLAAAIVNNTYTVPNREMLLNYCHIKRLFLEGIMMFIMGLEVGTTKGDSRRRKALEAFEESQQHVLRVLPGDRLASEMELTWFIKRCNKFKKIMKKGFLIEGAFTNKRRRTEVYAETGVIPKENIVPCYPPEIKRIQRAEEKRKREADGELVETDNDEENENQTSIQQPSSANHRPVMRLNAADLKEAKGGADHAVADGDKKEEKEEEDYSPSLIVKTFVNDEDIRLLPPPITPSATHYHLVEAMIVLSAPSLSPSAKASLASRKNNNKNANGGSNDNDNEAGDVDEFALSVPRGGSLSSSTRSTPTGTPRKQLDAPAAAALITANASISLFPTDENSSQLLREMLDENSNSNGRPPSAATQAREKASQQQPTCSHCAALFYVDLNMEDASIRSNARTAVALAIRAARLDKNDRIGFISFDKFGEPLIITSDNQPRHQQNSLTGLSPADENTIARFTQAVLDKKVNAKFEGSHGPALVRGILGGVELLKALEQTENERNTHITASSSSAVSSQLWEGNKNIFIISDGVGNGIDSDFENWKLVNTPETRETIANSGVQIHCFGATDAADHELLDTLSKLSRGDSGSNRGAKGGYTTDTTTMKMTQWLVSVLSSIKQRVASSVEIRLKCSAGILIANAVSEYYSPPPTTQYNKLPTEAIIPALPIAAEDESHVIVTFAVPATHTKKDIIDLAEGSVDFFDSVRGQYESRPLKIVNVCSTRVLSREIHFWATQLQVVGSRGACHLTSTTASRTLLRGGEIVMNHDLVSTSATDVNAFTNLVSIEGTRFELSSNTSILFNEVAVNKIALSLSRGTVKIITANECSVTVEVDSCYKIDINPSSYASITFDSKLGEFSANCVVGNAKITCTDEDAIASNRKKAGSSKKRSSSTTKSTRKQNTSGGKAGNHQEVVLLPAPRQTIATVPDTPTTPWVVDERTFFPWVDTSNCDVFTARSKNKLKNRIRIETHRLRTKAADTLRKVWRWLERSMRDGGSLPFFNPSGSRFATVVCRQIVLHVYLTRSKGEITNSVAYSTSNKALDKIRRTIDEFINIVNGKNRSSRSWSDVTFALDSSRGIATERAVGGSSQTYQTSDATHQVFMLQSEKTQFAHLLKEQQQRELDQGRNQERERRETLLQPIYASIDFGASNRAEVRHILTILYDLPNCVDAAPTLEDILLTVGTTKSLSEEQFCTVINHCAGALSPQQFDRFAAVFSENAEALSKKIEMNRMSRALFSVFVAIDREFANAAKKKKNDESKGSAVVVKRDILAAATSTVGSYNGPETDGGGGRGFVTIPELVSLFQLVFGDNLQQFKRVEAFTRAAMNKRNELIEKAKKALVLTRRKARSRPTGGDETNPSPAPPQFQFSDDTEDGTSTAGGDADTSYSFSGASSTNQPMISDLTQVSQEEHSPPASNDKEEEKKKTESNCSPTNVGSSEKAEEKFKGPHWELVTLENIAGAEGTEQSNGLKVTLDVFISAMSESFFNGVPESTAHAQLAQIRKQVEAKAKLPQTMEGILIQQKLEEERQHLVQWDLRHIFDGIDKKRDIPRITAEGFKPNEEELFLFQLLCAPVCLLADIDAPTAKRSDAPRAPSATNNTNSNTNGGGAPISFLSSYYTDYFSGVQKCLREDWQGFLKLLQSYPPLSVTHKQAIKVSEHLKDPRIAPEAAVSRTPVLAQLLAWARLVLRIAYLTNQYDAAPPIADKILSEAVAIQKKAEALIHVPRIAEEKKVAPTPSATRQAPLFETSFKPVFGTKPGVQNEQGFGTVTKYIAEPPPPVGSSPRLGKPKLMRVTGAAAGQSGTSAILAKMAEDVQKKTYGILAAAEVERCYRDDGYATADGDNRPASAPAHVGSEDEPQTKLSPKPPQSPPLLGVGNTNNNNNRSQLSFRHLGTGEQQRLHRKLSSTTTAPDASYLKTRGSQLNFGPSVAQSSSALSAHYTSQSKLTSTMIPSPPPAKRAEEGSSEIKKETVEGGGKGGIHIVFDNDLAPMITLNVSAADEDED